VLLIGCIELSSAGHCDAFGLAGSMPLALVPVDSSIIQVHSVLSPEMFDHEKTPLKGIVETQAPGVGDEAHYMTTPGFGTGLSVKKGSSTFKIRVYGFSDEAVKQKERELAQNALAKL
jgi:hypothetical protein